MAITFNHNDQVYVKDGKMGIGASDPLRNLHVVGNFAVNAGTDEYYGVLIDGGESATPRITIGDWHNSSATIKWDSSNNYLVIDSQHSSSTSSIIFTGNDSATEYMRITGTGNVGIGITDPQADLHIGANSPLLTLGVINTSTGNAKLQFFSKNDGTANGYAIQYTKGTGVDRLDFIDGSGNPNIVFKNGGNVGIGTTNPSEKLEVLGDIKFGGSTNGDWAVLEHGTKSIQFTQSNSGSGGHEMRFRTPGWSTDAFIYTNGSTERFRITGTGNVGIGTTSPQTNLDVFSGTGGTLRLGTSDTVVLDGDTIGRIEFFSSDATNTNSGLGAFIDLVADGSQDHFNPNGDLRFGTSYASASAATTRMTIKGNGNVGIGTTSPDHKLEVDGDVGLNDGYRIWFRGSNSSYGTGAQSYIFSDGLNLKIKGDDNVQLLGDGGGVILHADYTGNVGIGTTSPGNRLTISGPSSNQLEIINNANSKSWRPNVNGNDFYITETGVGNPFAIQAGGNVGIGTTSPSSKLDVNGTVSITGSNATGVESVLLQFNAGSDQLGSIRTYNAGGYNQHTRFYTSNVSGTGETLAFMYDQTGNVGIGTTSPQQKLDVNGNAYINGRLYVSGTDPYIWSVGTNALRIKHTDGQTMYIRPDETGNVSFFEGADAQNVYLMTSTPTVNSTYKNSAKLHLQARAKKADGTVYTRTPKIQTLITNIENQTSQLEFTGASTYYIDNVLTVNGNTTSTGYLQSYGLLYHRNSITALNKAENGWVQWATRNTSGSDTVINLSNIGTLTTSGNVGIGTTSPTHPLHVEGYIATNSSSNVSGLLVRKAGSTIGFVGQSGGWVGNTTDDLAFSGETGKNIRFYTNGSITERMRITDSGNVGIGTTSPVDKLHVEGVIQSKKELLPSTSGTAGWYKIGTMSGFTQGGATAVLEFAGHQGYNAINSQDYLIKLFLKTSNGNGGGPDGQGYNSWYERTGGNNATIEFKWDNSATNDYDLYMYIPIHSLRSWYSVKKGTGTWEHVGTSATDPGANSSTVLKATGLFNILDANVGIGTSSPSEKLDVRGNIELGDGGTGASLKYNSTNRGTILVNGSEIMRLEAAGNVGIGTTSPLSGSNNYGLHIDRGDHSTIVLGDPFNNSHGGFVQTSDNKHRVVVAANVYDDRTGSWSVAESGKGHAGISMLADTGNWGTNMYFWAGDTDTIQNRMVITAGGNVGIGTTSPNAKLQVGGNLNIFDEEGNTDASLFVSQGSTNTTTVVIASNGNSYFNGGNVGIGKTDPSAPLHINGGSTNQVVKIQSTTAPYVRFKEGGTDVGFIQFGTDSYISNQKAGTLNFRTNNTDKMTILSGGNVGIGTTSPSYKLHVDGDIGVNGNDAFKARYDTSENYHGSFRWAGLQLGNNGANKIIAGRTAAGGYFQFYVNNTNDASDYSVTPDGTKILTLAADGTSTFTAGNVGIGTTSPSYPLHVVGDIFSSSRVIGDDGISTRGVFKSWSVYSYSNGILIQTDIDVSTANAWDNRMIMLTAYGMTYSAEPPITASFQCYNYNNGQSIVARKGISTDESLTMDVFHYNGKVCFFMEQTSNYQTWHYELQTMGYYHKINSISNVAKPSTGITNDYTITPVKWWHGDNDGSGSGLDADLLDGLEATAFATAAQGTKADTAHAWGDHSSAGYAPLASPALTGTPTAPTAGSTTNTTQIATTAFVQTAVSNLVDSAPGTLDTLNELAAALGDDANFSTTMTTALGNRLRIDTNAQGLNATQQANGRTNLGLGGLATLGTASDINWTGTHSFGELVTFKKHIRLNDGSYTGDWGGLESTQRAANEHDMILYVADDGGTGDRIKLVSRHYSQGDTDYAIFDSTYAYIYKQLYIGTINATTTGTSALIEDGGVVKKRTLGSLAFDSTTLGTAATSNTGDFATAAQGTKADTAHGWGDHSTAGYSTATGVANNADNYGGWHAGNGADTQLISSGDWVNFDGGVSISGSGTEVDPYLIDLSGVSSYTAGSGLDLSSGAFSVEPDLRDSITHVGKDTDNYIQFDADGNGHMDFYVNGVWSARLEADGDLHVKGDVIAFSNIFNP